MQDRHTNREKYFSEQAQTVQNHVIPFIENGTPIHKDLEVLEIDCGEGGNLKPFLEAGCKVTGIDLSASKIDNGKNYFKDHPNYSNMNFIVKDVYDIGDELNNKFDIIIMRDVLEHIHNQEKFMKYVKKFMKPSTKFFLGFPPWQNPFGGHQQVCVNKFLSIMPFIHLLPNPLYVGLLKLFNESESKINSLLEVKETRISIERFNRILKRENYSVDKVIYYLINPNYEIKFNLKTRKQSKLISSIPYLRNFAITTCYYLISKTD